MQYCLPPVPLRRESQHVRDASGKEMTLSFAELLAASWCTYMGPPAKDRRFLTSLQPGNVPTRAGIRPCLRVTGSSSYMLWISVISTASGISRVTHMPTSFALDGMYLSKCVLLRAGKRMQAGTYMSSPRRCLPQMGQLACEKPVGCSKDWSRQHMDTLSPAIQRCFFEFGFKERAQARQKEEIWGNLKWLGICYCNHF